MAFTSTESYTHLWTLLWLSLSNLCHKKKAFSFIQNILCRLDFPCCCCCCCWRVGLRASPVVFSMWSLQNIFLTSKFSYLLLFFCNLSHKSKNYIQVLVIYFFATSALKVKLGVQTRARQLIANHLDESLWLTNQKTREQQSHHIYYTLLSRRCGAELWCAYYQQSFCFGRKTAKSRHWSKFLAKKSLLFQKRVAKFSPVFFFFWGVGGGCRHRLVYRLHIQ